MISKAISDPFVAVLPSGRGVIAILPITDGSAERSCTHLRPYGVAVEMCDKDGCGGSFVSLWFVGQRAEDGAVDVDAAIYAAEEAWPHCNYQDWRGLLEG